MLLLIIVIMCVRGYSFLTSEDITILSKDAKGNAEIGLKITLKNYEGDTDKKEDDDIIKDVEDQFSNIDEIKNVKGIGIKKYEAIKDLITIKVRGVVRCARKKRD